MKYKLIYTLKNGGVEILATFHSDKDCEGITLIPEERELGRVSSKALESFGETKYYIIRFDCHAQLQDDLEHLLKNVCDARRVTWKMNYIAHTTPYFGKKLYGENFCTVQQ